MVKDHIRDVWNSMQFRFQRKLTAAGDWSYCRGASCAFDPFRREDKFLADTQVVEAISGKKEFLEYGPKIVAVIPSHGCNSDCYSCFQSWMKDRMRYHLHEEILREIEETIIPDTENVIVSGGEPFFVPQTRSFIERIARDHPHKHISINTNGTLLHEFGLEKIFKRQLFLTIAVYGMEAGTYEKVTKRNNFDQVFANIKGLIDLGHTRMQIGYLINKVNRGETEAFCEFIARHEGLNGLVRNDWYEGTSAWELMHRMEARYAAIASRLKFEYQNESALKIVSRRLYNPIHSVKYCICR